MASASLSCDGALRRAAEEALLRQDWPELLFQASRLRQDNPDDPDGYVWVLTAFTRLRPSLRTLMTEALQRFPDQPQLQTLAARDSRTRRNAKARAATAEAEAATAAELRSLRSAIQTAVKAADWPKVTSLCASLRSLAPDDLQGYQLGSRAWREQKRFRQAEIVSRGGISRFPDHPDMLRERAITLHRRDRLSDSLACYDRLRHMQPCVPAHYSRVANLLVLLGRLDEAEAILQTGLNQFGDEVDLLVHRAIVATRRSDFPLARARWEEVRRVAPDDPRLSSFAGTMALAEQLQSLPDNPELPPDPEIALPAVELTDETVMRRFESLGGNCEFGLAQRAAGIEPLGLLRFAAITTHDLIALLRARLEGVGSEAQTTLQLNGQREYMLEDPRFRTHTFINYGDTDAAELLSKLRRRTVFLRDKLLTELRRGNKTFLFRPLDGLLAESDIAELHGAVRLFGPGPLVCIRNADPGDDRVAVDDRGDGLFVATMPGHDSRLSLNFVQTQRYAYWIALCRAVLAASDDGAATQDGTQHQAESWPALARTG